MTDFTLHPQLASDCYQLGSMEVSRLLLMNNALVPWFILVPLTDKRELYQLDAEQQYLIQQEINVLSAFLIARPDVEKINIGALGNLVPQLHLHVIGRNPHDYCWPAPVWGQAEKQPYSDQGDQIRQQLKAFLADLPVNFVPYASNA